MAAVYFIYIFFTGCVFISSLVSNHHDFIEMQSEVIVSVQHFCKSDCLYFIAAGDFSVINIQRRLSGHGISSAVTNPNNLQTSCNTPIYTVFDDEHARLTFKHLSDANKLSSRIWLLFIQDSSDLDEYFLNINIPFDCELIVAAPLDSGFSLTEVYRVAPRLQLQKISIGSFRPGKGASWSPMGFHDRRSDLHDIVITMTIKEWPPLVYLKVDPFTNKTVSVGLDGEFIKIFQKHMNFQIYYQIPKDNGWSIQLGNGSWNGMVGALLRNEADMTACRLSMTPERFQYVAFTTPASQEYEMVFIRQPDRTASLGGLMFPFSLKLWSAFVCSAVALSAILALVYSADFRDTAFKVFAAIFCQQGSAEPSSASSKRMLLFIVHLLGTVALSSYSCFFVSSLTDEPKLPFTNLKGLLDDGSFSLGMVGKTWTFNMFKNAKNNNLLRQLYDRNIATDPANVVVEAKDGYENACKKKYAFIRRDEPNLKASCVLTPLPDYFSMRYDALAFPKNSPFIGIFNSVILKLMSNGIVSKLNKDEHFKLLPKVNTQVSASLENVIPILALGAAGVILSLLVLAVELFISHRCREDVTPVVPGDYYQHGKRTTDATAPILQLRAKQ